MLKFCEVKQNLIKVFTFWVFSAFAYGGGDPGHLPQAELFSLSIASPEVAKKFNVILDDGIKKFQIRVDIDTVSVNPVFASQNVGHHYTLFIKCECCQDKEQVKTFTSYPAENSGNFFFDMEPNKRHCISPDSEYSVDLRLIMRARDGSKAKASGVLELIPVRN